jgi:hypothetical protein
MQDAMIETNRTRRLSRRHILALAGAGAGATVLAACGGATETPRPAITAYPAQGAPGAASTTLPTTGGTAVSSSSVAGQLLAIEAFDFGFKTLRSIPGGVTTVQLKNTGSEPHHAQFMLLNPGVTPQQFGDGLKQGPDGIFPLVTAAGGPGMIAPNGATEVVLDLAPGQYMLVCFVPGADHLPHAAKGMVLPLTVTAPAAASFPMPGAIATVTLYEYSFEMPATLPAGRNLYRVVNQGAQFHEFTVIKLAPGKTLADVKAFFDPPPGAPPAGPPPGLPIGGMNALGRGASGLAVLDLSPGDYVALCNVPDQSKQHGDSHLHLGMIKGFSVA